MTDPARFDAHDDAAAAADHPVADTPSRTGPIPVVLLGLACAAVLVHLRPPQADELGFSTATACEHLAIISAEPRPLASDFNATVRAYLVDQLNALSRFEVTIQPHRFNDVESGDSWDIGNVIARLPGTTADPAVMLVAHYDSVEDSPGAADDGAAVVALLEVARILAEAPPLRRDVYLLLTDGEERGLWGARAFVEASDHVDFVGVVLNFEARGSTGPSMMFETSGDNAWLIREYARAVEYPVVSSISDDLYHAMPNDTDLTRFARVNIPGMNFAFIGTPKTYHTPDDDMAHLDRASLRHHGLNGLMLARHLADLETFGADDGRAVYFSVPWYGVVYYPATWAVPTSLVAVVVAALVCVVGLARRWVKVGPLGIALACGLAQLAVVGAIAYLSLLVRDASLTTTAQAAGHLLLIGGATLLLTQGIGAWLGQAEAALAVVLWTAVFGLMIAQPQPASSYLVVWPALFGSLAWLVVVAAPRARSAAAVGSVLSIPAVVILLPVAYLATVGLGANAHHMLASAGTGYRAATLLALFPALLTWQVAVALHGAAGRTRTALAVVLAAGGAMCYMVP